jgi:hypothetical protein
MAAVTSPGGGDISGWAERNNAQAKRLLGLMAAAKPIQHMAAPTLPHIGGDHPKPQGMFVEFLFGPGSFVWPQDSESALANDATSLGQQEQFYGEKADEVGDHIKQAFNNYWTAGKGAEAAESAYKQTMNALLDQAEVCKVAKGLVSRVSDDVGRTKRLMAQESDAAHAEVEAFLRSGSGQSTAQVAVILAAHRTIIQGHGAELHGHVANDTLLFTNKFKLAPGGGPKVRDAGNGTSSDPSTDPAPPPPGQTPGPAPSPNAHGPHSVSSSDNHGGVPGPGGLPGQASPFSGLSSDAAPGSGPGPWASLLGSGGGFPGLSGMPGMPSGGGGGFPMSGLQGMFSNFGGGFPGAGMGSPAGLGAGMQATPTSFGADFGRGLAASAAAAGGGVPPVAPVPTAPVTPLTAPIESAPTTAAAAAAPLSAPSPASAPAPAAPAAGMPAAGMTPYGSVLPPGGSSMPTTAGSMPAPASIPEGGGGAAPAAAGAGAGLLPVAGRRDGAPVRRDLAESDLQLARLAVAELAGAASVVDAGLDWAVAVGRNPTSGQTTLWVATNDGATYIPPGVYLRKTMPIAARFDDDFDARWFGWVNPAEKAVRAARARGDAVGAVATTWGWGSDFLEDPESGVREVAIGVPQFGSDSPASELLPSRSHRLQTVDAALYADLQAAGERGVRDYCRELVRRLAFGGLGDELSPVAQSVADALVGGRWPKIEEWAALGAEYETALLLMGAQRPGLNGILDADQAITYEKLFVNCRRLEALLCWDRFGGDLSNVVYAAWVAGVCAPLKELALH